MNFFSPWDIIPECFGDSGHSHLLRSLIQKSLRKPMLLQEESFLSLLPLVEIEFLESQVCSVFLICPFSPGVEKFFNEMLSRWLLPGKKLISHFFIHSTFSFSKDPLEKFSFSEIRFPLQGEQDAEYLRRNFSQIAQEIRLGAGSPYQAHKILEHRGLFSSEKNSLIQEKVAALIHRRPEDFDYDVFGQMQHFFLSSREDFKQIREHPHLSRIVYIFYLFRKRLRKVTEKNPDKRHVSFKVSQVRLHQSFGLQKVLGVFVGINFLKKNELFEEHHLLKAIQEHVPNVVIVKGSLFVYLHKDERIQIIYLEIKKEDESEISPLEIQLLRKRFPYALENQVEKLMPALFMPRNEEEVMKNVIRLSQELKYIKDIPQVMISFEEQTDVELTFTIVLLRVLLEKEPSIRELFKGSCFTFIEDRVKRVGVMREKYPKEATVFRLKLSKALYMRNDHTVDLLKARQSVFEALQEAVGEFRDYNGGMIAKQSENLKAFKALLGSSYSNDHLESFFHSLYPVEMRSVVDPLLLQSLYVLWNKMMAEDEEYSFDFSFRLEKDGVVLMTRFSDEEIKSSLSEGIRSLDLSSSQWMFFSSQKGSYIYQGYLLLGMASTKGELLIEHVQKIQDRLCFSC